MKKTIAATIDQHADTFIEISRYIGEHPELGHEEWLASRRLMDELKRHGFEIQNPVQRNG